MEWSKNHRWHHLHSDSSTDRHSPRDGLWHAHMGWLFDERLAGTRADSRGNMKDSLAAPWFLKCAAKTGSRVQGSGLMGQGLGQTSWESGRQFAGKPGDACFFGCPVREGLCSLRLYASAASGHAHRCRGFVFNS